MIELLAEAVADGQPRSVVISHSEKFIPQLRRRLRDALVSRGVLPLDISRRRILADGSSIDFVTVSEIDRWKVGRSGHGEFWDHFADGIQ